MDILRQRVLFTERYLKELERSFSAHWTDAHKALQPSGDWVAKLAFIHPEHYRDIAFSGADCLVRGVRGFAKEAAMSAKRCGSDVIWDYRCPIEPDGSTMSADHLFPHGFGGPTLASNKIYLCARHNAMKGSDLHCFPWEKGAPTWLDETLNLLAKLKSQHR
jgi:hypothetical protein